MTTFDINVILTRLSKIEDYLKRLEKYQSTTLDEYSENKDIQLITERLIQVMTEAALDIIKHLLSCLGVLRQKESWTNKDYFLEAANLNIISSEIANQLVKAAGMRNILVHIYLNIEPEQVFFAIAKSLEIYPIYIHQITLYLDSLDENF
jgi:uncharacterized protein YutE (UPF0331/DUF86 family)